MAWIYWLLAPLSAISATAVLTWWFGRPRKPVSVERALTDHRLYLSDLADAAETGPFAGTPARSRQRTRQRTRTPAPPRTAR